jgi:hypothetical protein
MTRESNVYARLKDRICRPEDRFERMENGLVDGMPDVTFCMAGAEGWIEIKAPREPARPTTALFGAGNHQVSVEQCNWMLKQTQAGGWCWLFIATEERLVLVNGSQVGRLGVKINTLTAHEIERISDWKAQVPVLDQLRWFDLREILTTQ